MEGIDSPPQSSGSFFTPLLISMVGIVVTSLAIVLYHLVVVKYCLRPQEIASTPSQRIPLATGVDEKILDTIPILSYSTKKGELFRVDQSECFVCLGELDDGDMVRLLPSCRHAFHIPCIDKWFVAHTSCPVCRSPIVAPMTFMPPLPACVDEGDGDELQPDHHQFHDQGSDVNPSTSRVRSFCLLRHCASLVLPMETKPKSLVKGLKRSLSMDHSYVILDIQRESERASSSSSSSLKGGLIRSRSYRAQSIRHLDHVSSKLMRSFSRLQIGRSSRVNGILPY